MLEGQVLMVKAATDPLAAFRLPTKASVRFRGSEPQILRISQIVKKAKTCNGTTTKLTGNLE